MLEPDDVALLEALAAHAALTVSHARLVKRMVDAQDSERRRIERDIHDGAQQDLAALMGQLGLARERAKGDPELAATIDQLRAEARRILMSVRELAQGIHPSVLRDRGLVAAIEDRRAHLPVKLRLHASADSRSCRFDPTVEAAAYFTVSEAITNAIKHSGAEAVDITVAASEETLRVEVADHGTGFDPGGTAAGTGLVGMADRLQAIGGTVEIESGTGCGTVVRLDIPLSRTEQSS